MVAVYLYHTGVKKWKTDTSVKLRENWPLNTSQHDEETPQRNEELGKAKILVVDLNILDIASV